MAAKKRPTGAGPAQSVAEEHDRRRRTSAGKVDQQREFSGSPGVDHGEIHRVDGSPGVDHERIVSLSRRGAGVPGHDQRHREQNRHDPVHITPRQLAYLRDVEWLDLLRTWR